MALLKLLLMMMVELVRFFEGRSPRKVGDNNKLLTNKMSGKKRASDEQFGKKTRELDEQKSGLFLQSIWLNWSDRKSVV